MISKNRKIILFYNLNVKYLLNQREYNKLILQLFPNKQRKIKDIG